MSVMDRLYVITMPDGTKWGVPVRVIAMNRAIYYATKDNISVDESLNNDTIPLFECDQSEINDWAANNMDWDDVREFAIQIDSKSDIDYTNGWENGFYQIVADD